MDQRWTWSNVQLVATVRESGHVHKHLVTVRCVVTERAEDGKPLVVFVPWWRTWAVSAHGWFSMS